MTMRALAVAGNVNVDLIMGPIAPWPVPGSEVLSSHDDLRPGGAAGNTALAWAALGVPFIIASNIGDDVLGRWVQQSFSPASNGWAVTPLPTTISVGVTHPGDERTFFTTAGHLPHLAWPAVKGQLHGLEGGLLLLCGSFLTGPLTAEYTALFNWAKAHRVDVALDPGWPPQGWTGVICAQARCWLAHTKHLLVNEIEAINLANAANIDAALPILLAQMPEGAVVVVKAGSQGAFAMSAAGVVHVPAPTVPVIDTIGAGDIFNAGYLLAIARDSAIGAAVSAGVQLASIAISTSPRVYQTTEILAGVA